MTGRGRVCFFTPYVYPVTGNAEVEFVGGAEVIQWSLARGLAERGFDVSMVTCDYGQPARLVRENVMLIRSFEPHGGLRGLRFVHPRVSKSLFALLRARGDVYLTQGSGLGTGLCYDAARLTRSHFVFLAGHDFDALPSLPFVSNARERWWYRRGLRGADARVAQTDVQRRLFREHFGLDAELIRNPAELPSATVDPGASDGTVLWMATYKPGKRPEWFTSLAARLPHLRFVMAGGLPPGTDVHPTWEAAQEAGANLPNLEVHGFVERERIGNLLREASLFVHTSPAEGFPMAVLEAWSYGIPTVTAVDPDQIVTRERLGRAVETLDELVDAVETLMADAAERRAAGARARAYVERHHAADKIYDELATLLDRMIGEDRSGTRSPA